MARPSSGIPSHYCHLGPTLTQLPPKSLRLIQRITVKEPVIGVDLFFRFDRDLENREIVLLAHWLYDRDDFRAKDYVFRPADVHRAFDLKTLEGDMPTESWYEQPGWTNEIASVVNMLVDNPKHRRREFHLRRIWYWRHRPMHHADES